LKNCEECVGKVVEVAAGSIRGIDPRRGVDSIDGIPLAIESKIVGEQGLANQCHDE
jgi:hypothetical protein